MATYLPDPTANWFAAIRGGAVLMAPSSSLTELVALWPLLADDDPTSSVLDRLTAGGLAATPSFALVVRAANGSARVVVRGGLSVRTGSATVSGSGVATWTERVVDSDSFEIVVADSLVAGVSLPVVEGVVPAWSVSSEGAEPVVVAPPTVGVSSEPVEPVAAVVPPSAAVSAEPVPPVATTLTPSAPAFSTIPFPPPPPSAAEQTMVPAEDTIAGPSTPAEPMPSIPPAVASELDGDHDGHTVASVDLQRLRAQRAARAAQETPASGLPTIGASLTAQPARAVATPTPQAVSLRMPDGAVEPIGHEVVLGRAPSVSQVSGGRLPRLITVGAGDPDISRSHVRISVEGDTVVITDLHSRNGTHVVAPGKPPVKLRAGEPTPVLSGTVVDLGGGCTVQVVGD